VGLDECTLAVQVGGDAALGDAVELGVLAHHLLDAPLFQVGQVEVLEDHLGDLLDRELGFIKVHARFLARLLACAVSLLAGTTAEYIARLGSTLALAHALAPSTIEPDARQFQALHGDFNDLPLIGRDNVLMANDIADVLLNDLFDLLVMPLALAVASSSVAPVSCA